MILPMIASVFLIIAIVCFLNLTPKQITEDLSSVLSKKPNLRDRARSLRAGKKKKGLGTKLEYLQSALKSCGKEGMFALVCSSALVLFAIGAVVAVLINNIFLIPALSVAFAMIPFVYVRNIINIYRGNININRKILNNERKKFMEKLKQNKIIVILVIAIISVLIFIAVMIGHFVGNKNEPVTEPTTNIEETTDDVVIDGDISDEKGETESITEIEAEVIKLQEPTTEKTTTTQKSTQNTNTVKPAEPVTQKSSQSTNYEVIEGGNDSVNEYTCGSKGHHCDSKETHEFIVSLEKKGCPYCGAHSCKSFYTYDEWGNACYDPTKCESYNAKSDPCEYCQECGKKVGTGSGGTCVRFTVDTKCPECGKTVKGKTCHSH